MIKKLIFILSIIITFSLTAQNIPSRPNPPKLVNDFANVLTSEQVTTLENYLDQFALNTSTQVAVVTVKSLDGTDAADYAFKLGEKWGIGQKGKNNGILILIKPKYGNDKGHAFIATGYGLEGAVPDAYANQIVDHEMIPHFKQGDYYGGIASAVKTITELTKGEYTAEQYAKRVNKKGGAGKFIFLVILIIAIILLNRSRSNSKTYSSRGSSLPFWLLMGGMASSSHHRGSYGNFSSGSGGFGGFSGGGFGGFGGGSFGGGGAGGSW